MTASSTPLLLNSPVVGQSSVVVKKQPMGTNSSSIRKQKTLVLIQRPLKTLSLQPVARLLELAKSTTMPEQLKAYETQLVSLLAEKADYTLLWNELLVGSTQTQSLAMMVFLRSGSVARGWVASQLETQETVAIDGWVLSFLKHHFTL